MVEVPVLCEHADWVVVAKPSGLLVHPTRPDGQYTLLENLRDRYLGEPVSIVNRLDRETSGLVLAARSAEAASRLGRMTMRREFEKRYLALVWGEAPVAGTIVARLDRQGRHRPSVIHLKQAVVSDGATAITRFMRRECRSRDREKFSWLEVELDTGRLHQIRVHLGHIGHAVVGDKIYGPDENFYLQFIERDWTPEMESRLLLPRHALHAWKLSFVWNGEPVHVCCPLAPDLQLFWDGLTPEAPI